MKLLHERGRGVGSKGGRHSGPSGRMGSPRPQPFHRENPSENSSKREGDSVHAPATGRARARSQLVDARRIPCGGRLHADRLVLGAAIPRVRRAQIGGLSFDTTPHAAAHPCASGSAPRAAPPPAADGRSDCALAPDAALRGLSRPPTYRARAVLAARSQATGAALRARAAMRSPAPGYEGDRENPRCWPSRSLRPPSPSA